jgi:uncharacterized protein DUF4129
VLGYRGADARGDGNYDVRQCYAHTWVEVLVARRQQSPIRGLPSGPLTWHWLSLDPTPSEAADASFAASNRWWEFGMDIRRLYAALFVHFNEDNRAEFFNDLATAARRWWLLFRRGITARTPGGLRLRLATVLFALVIGVGMAHAAVQVRRRRSGSGARPSPATAFYRRLLAILARRGWKPAPSETAREFAAAVALRLRSRNDGADLAEVVRRTATLFERVRFGGVALQAAEAGEVRSRLDRLQSALAGDRG